MRNKLMVLGPTEIEDDVLAAGAIPLDYMRTPDYSERLRHIFENLQYIFETTCPVLIYACSGTGIMEAAVINSCTTKGSVLIVNGGSFGARWKDICECHGLTIRELKIDFGQSVDPKDIAKELEQHPEICAVFTTLDETSSGALTDIEAIGKIVNNYPDTLLICDCVSGLIVESLKMDDWHVDIAVTSSQKALALPPGLAFMAVSEKAQKRIRQKHLSGFYFDAQPYLLDWKRGQTPYTPPVSLLAQLELRLNKIRSVGLGNIREQYCRMTEYLRAGLKQLGLKVFATHPANAVTGIWIKDVDAAEIVNVIREKYHIEIAPSGGELKNNFIRIGNLGNINKEDIDELLHALKETISELRETNDRK